MNLFSILNVVVVLICVSSLTAAKRQQKRKDKDPNTIAIFSEDDISGKLPSPESVAAQIPKKMILQKTKKLKATTDEREQPFEKKKKSKNSVLIVKKDEEEEAEDPFYGRKSKSMSYSPGVYDENPANQFTSVEPTPIPIAIPLQSSLPTDYQQIPTATIFGMSQMTQSNGIQKFIDVTATKDEGCESTTKSRKVIERVRVKRASSSACKVAISIHLTIFTFVFLLIVVA